MARVHSALGALAMQQVKKMRGNGFAVGINHDALAVVREVVPVKEHRRQRGQQRIGNVARARGVVVLSFRPHAAQDGDARAQHVHGMRVSG